MNEQKDSAVAIDERWPCWKCGDLTTARRAKDNMPECAEHGAASKGIPDRISINPAIAARYPIKDKRIGDVEYVRVRSDSPSVEPLGKLLARYAQPCTTDCEHSQCPLLRELHELAIKQTLQDAQRTVQPIIDAEKRGEDIGDLMTTRLGGCDYLYCQGECDNGSPSLDEAAVRRVAEKAVTAVWRITEGDNAFLDRKQAQIEVAEIISTELKVSDSGKVEK